MDIDKLLADSSEDSEETVATKETVSSEENVGTKAVATTGKKETKPKKKGKPRGGNSPVIGTNGFNLDAGDNAKFLSVNMALFNMPNIDMESESEVQQRLSDYFALYANADMKPTVAGMAMALNGMSRQTLWAITHDAPLGGRGNYSTLPPSVTDTIKKAYFLLENLWESYMNSGKVNPVAGIFLGKNNYGYQDKTEYVLTPNQQNDNDYSADEIRERYIASDQQTRTTKRLSPTLRLSDYQPSDFRLSTFDYETAPGFPGAFSMQKFTEIFRKSAGHGSHLFNALMQ